MTLYYVQAFGTVVYGPFKSDSEMMDFHYNNFEHGDLLSVHESKEAAEREVQQNKVEIESQESQLEDVGSHYYK